MDASPPPSTEDRAFPPAGWLDRHETARRLGVHPSTLKKLERLGKVPVGRRVNRPGDGAGCVLYHEAEVDCAAAAMREEAQAPFPPAGFVGLEEACRLLGVQLQTYQRWFKQGRIQFGQWVLRPDGRYWKIFPVKDVLAFRERIDAERGRVPEGYLTLVQAAAMFGKSVSGWKKWIAAGLVPRGERVQLPLTQGRPALYRREELERLRDELDALSRPYLDPERPDVARVPVMSFRTKLCEALIDAADLPRVEGRRWNWMDRGNGALPAIEESGRGGGMLKSVVLGLDSSAYSVTHANGDPLDCRRANLVVRDHREKSHGASKSRGYGGRPCSSSFKGVSWVESRGKWRAMIKVEEGSRHLGEFHDEIAAAQAYDEAAKAYYGEHAFQNFPDGVDRWLERDVQREAA